ncbi:MAG: hypothetical protein ACREIU_15805, partial [Planctomycetota bacterium]
MRRRTLLSVSSLLALAPVLGACGGCGCSKSEAPPRAAGASAEKSAPEGSAAPAAARAYQAAPATDASIAGTATLEGDPPKMPPLNFDADPVCSQVHG